MRLITKHTLILFIFAFIAGFSLLNKGLPPTHDGEYHVIRFIEFDKTLSSGSFYPRWSPDLNYGYGIPLFNYVYPLPNYVSSFFHSFGVSFINAFKLNFLTAILLAGLFFYLWTKSFFEKKGALIGAIFYLFSPYMFVDIYIRGSVGEVWALALFPAFLWAITEFVYKKRQMFFPVSIVFLSLIIFSHNILALMFFPFAILYSLLLIFLEKNKKTIFINILSLFILAVGLSAIFWLPALSEAKYTVGLQIFDYKRNFPEVFQLLFPSWGSGFFGGSLDNQMSVQIGVANLLAIFIGVIVFIKLFRKKDFRAKLLGFFLISFFVVIFLMLRVSLPIWEKIPLMNYFQFPWRFLSLIILICSFLAAGTFSIIKKKVFFILMFFLPLVLTFNYAHPSYYMDRTDNYYATRPNFIDGTNSIGNSFNTLWFNAKPVRTTSKIQTNKDIIVNNTSIKPANYKFEATVLKPSVLTVNTAYFPGWEAKIDGKLTQVRKNNEGLITIPLLEGKHSLEINFSDTQIRKISSLVSIISFILVVTLFFKTWYSRERK